MNDDPDIAVVHEVFARVRARDRSVADLYAPDAQLRAHGRTHIGREEIRAFYESVFESTAPRPTVVGLWRETETIAALVEATTTVRETRITAIDVFTVRNASLLALTICRLPTGVHE